MLEKSLVPFLASHTDVVSLIGSGSILRVYPLIIPQKQPAKDQMPCIVYTISGEQRQKNYCGTSPLVQLMFSLDYYATTALKARELANAVRNVLVDYRGPMGEFLVSDVTLENSMTQYDMEPGLLRVIDMFSMWYQ
jgi:hypothetical protein